MPARNATKEEKAVLDDIDPWNSILKGGTSRQHKNLPIRKQVRKQPSLLKDTLKKNALEVAEEILKNAREAAEETLKKHAEEAAEQILKKNAEEAAKEAAKEAAAGIPIRSFPNNTSPNPMEPRARAGKNRGQQNFSDQDLQMLLYAHGDVANSLDSTKKVLDEILTDFIIELCFEADRSAQLSSRQKVKVDDFKWACRKDPLKLGKIEESFTKKAEFDAAKKAFDPTDDKLTKTAIDEMLVDEPLGDADDDQDTQTVGGKSVGGKSTGKGTGTKARK